MPAGAPKGNKNALVWTKEKCLSVIDQLKKLVNEKEIYIISGQKVQGYKYDFIGELTLELGYNREILKKEILHHAPELTSEVNRLYSYMERNCYTNTKKGIIREATGIVNLKSNHKWTDRIDNTSNDKELKNQTSDPFKQIADNLKSYEADTETEPGSEDTH